mmetsp:Transcript_14831/g.46488  ORF Transcript_14831/g.46488 Transcript_14831/m.46488 type:complete len:300 (-) Transcript_14831:30-929(-)|eukprot:CAMPEP_0170738392 /NCGR_PEP_ID=MMETSP0437-20130122/4622_1 /TAXON_ID=0 /ORGANISM="Sexangularia sp." /LENGTH=299 /DNA_ID=CAMNT_0011076815 /DNA_START=144 /DNA_END=1043 /DNA_ORIENTATION=-
MSAIRKQVDFYFSDDNLPRDNFLLGKIKEDAAGFVDISVILTFNRMKSLATSVTEIAEAVKDSDVVELDAEKTRLRRRAPLPPSSSVDDRTLVTTGYPPNVTWESISEFWSKHAKVSSVRLANKAEGKAPSAIVTFVSREEAEKALAADAGMFTGAVVPVAAEWKSKVTKDASSKLGLKLEEEVTPGTLLSFQRADAGAVSGASINKALVAAGHPSVFVAYQESEETGVIHMKTAEAAKALSDKSTSDDFSLKVDAATTLDKLPLVVLEGQAEKDAWERIQTSVANVVNAHARVKRRKH